MNDWIGKRPCSSGKIASFSKHIGYAGAIIGCVALYSSGSVGIKIRKVQTLDEAPAKYHTTSYFHRTIHQIDPFLWGRHGNTEFMIIESNQRFEENCKNIPETN